MKSSYTILGLCLGTANALLSPLPNPTHNVANDLGYGFEPLPTTKPMMPRDLLRRQGSSNSGSLVGYLAPDNTCGYVSGIQSSIKTCDSTQLCAAVVVSGVASMGCCDTGKSNCQFLGNCVDSAGFYSSSECGAACKADVNTLKCTAASKPFCYSYINTALTMGFYSCASTTSASFAPFATTYSGQASVSWRKVFDNDASSKDPLQAATSNLSGKNAFSSLSSAASQGTSTPEPSSDKKSTPVGAIAGGVVGGLAVIGIAIAGVLFFCIKKRNNAAAAAASAKEAPSPPMAANASNVVSPAMQQQQPYQTAYDPNNPQGYYPQQHSEPNYNNYFGGAAAVGNMTHDQKLGAYDNVNSLPTSPAPMYHPSMSPPPQHDMQRQSMMSGPSPALSNVDIAQPPAGYHEAPGAAVVPAGVIPAPHLGAGELDTTAPAAVAAKDAPVELGSETAVAKATAASSGAAAPIELGTNPAAPKQNAEGNQVFEMGG